MEKAKFYQVIVKADDDAGITPDDPQNRLARSSIVVVNPAVILDVG